MKKIVNENLAAIRVLIVALLIISGVAPAMAGHGGPHYARVTVTATPTGQGKVYMTTDGDYLPESEDWQNSMSATWNCNDDVNNEADSRTYYVHAQPTSGYHFVKWSSNNSGSDSKSTDAKYAYSTSASGTSSSPTANNIYAVFAANPEYTCTFLTSENGTYKYRYGESEEVTVESEHSVTTNENFTLTALPAAGYMLYGWYTKSGSTKTYFDYSSTTISSYALPGNVRIGVDFVPAGTPIFQIKGSNQTYTDLNAAISACGAATKTIVLINNGTLPAGNYTIPANATLLIPFDEGFTCYTEEPALTSNSFLTPEVFRTLTMNPGATLTVNGAVSVSAKLSSRSGYGPNGATSGKYGAIKMLSEGNTKSKITLNSGAKLYGWGYIYGEGAVEALSGSTVYEGFVITDWRGGNNTLDMYNNKDKYKVFPFNQYYIQNIEVPLTIHKGATESVYSSVYSDGSDNPLSITMVGESSGLFRLTGTGAKLTKWYDPLYDRQHYELEGAAAINAISFTAFSMTVSSSAFVLPITNNMDITVRSGATVSIAEDVCIMPDASVTVEQGATMTIAKNVYVYDIRAYTNAGTYTTSRGGYPSAGAGRYAAGAYVRRISYSPSWAALSDREIRRLQNMSSAHFQVNGTLTVNGKLYTTEGGADIFSAADGAAVNLVSGAGTANKTYQVDHENYDAYYYTIPVTSAKLHNADGSYQATAGNAANTTWTYAHGHWGWCIIWRLEDGTELKRMYQPAQPNATWISSNAPETSKPDEGTCSYVFNGWNTVTNTSQQEIEVTAGYTKTCAEYYDVLWKSEDGTETYETDENVGKGETTRYNGAAPSKADDKTNGFTYTFDGWTTQPNGGGTKYSIGNTPAATGDITYYAHFAASEVAAIITANGVVSYYPSIADAFTAANNSTYTPTIQVWRDAPNTPALTYTAKNHCTLDLNGHTVSGTNMPLLTINDEGFTFTITDRTETKEGRLAGTSGASTAFVVSLVSGVFRLEAGTVYGQNTGTGVMAGVYAGANREVIMTGGTIQVDANSGTGYGIFAQGKGTINGGTIRVESSAKSAYAVQAQGSNGNVTVTDGKFYVAGSSTGTVTCVLANGSASMTVNGGYYNINTNLATYLGAGCHVFNLPASELPYKYKVGAGGYTVTFQNTDGTMLQSGLWENGTTPEYTGDAPTKPGDTGGEYIHSSWTPELAPVTGDATYTATYIPTPPVASVTISGTTTNYIHFDDAWTAVNGATAASTIKLLDDVALASMLTFTSGRNCTFDLNDYTITNTDLVMFNLNNASSTFTLTDGSEGQSGKVSVNSTSVGSTAYGVLVSKGRFVLAAGTIEANLKTVTSQGVRVANGASFTMNGGKIDLETTNNRNGDGVFVNTTGTATIGGGEIHVNAAATGYAVNAAGTTTITGGNFSAEGGSSAACVYRTGTLTLQGGYYSLNTNLADNCATNYHVFPNSDATYLYKVAEAYTLTWSTDGDALTGDYTSGLIESGATIVAPATPTKTGYTFAGWSPAFTGTMPAASTTYTAQWAVASVTISGTTTLYTTFLPAWTAANSATAASTLTLLQDVTVTAQLTYNNSNNKNCTLDLNGHTLTSNTSQQSPLHINNANVTFTVTDGTEEKSGKLSLTTSYSAGTIFGVYVENGTLLLNAGTIEVRSGSATACGVTVNKGTFTMNGGTIHVVTTNSKEGRGIYSAGTVTVHNGTILVEAEGNGYGLRRDGGTITVNGGKFNITGSTASYMNYKADADNNLIIRGGYYNIDTRLGTYVSAPYHVFDLTSGTEFDEGYRYKVAEGYTVTFMNEDETLQSGLWEKGTTPIYSGESPVKAATAQYTYTFDDWSPAITPVTANATYTAQFSSTVNTYTVTWKNADGTTLETDENVPYGTTPAYNGATPTKATDAEYAYAFDTWSPAVSAVTGDVTYTATYTTTPVVASVTANSTTAYYTLFADAWTAANSAAAAVTLTLLQDISGLSSSRTYSTSHNLTLDLNGHTLSGSGTITSLFNISCTGYTFTVTDGSANHDGKLSFSSGSGSTSHCVIVTNGTFVLEAGMMEATSSTASIGAVQVVGGTFTMNENGAVHVNYTGNVNGKNSRLVHANGGTTTINGGSIRLESKKDAIGVVYSSGNVTFNGGLFNISASGTAAVTNQNVAKDYLNIQGGYYSANTTGYFEPHVKTPYHIFSNSDATYIYRVAAAYTLTWTTDGDALTGTYTSGLTEVGTPIVAPNTPTKTGCTFAGWSYPVAETMPAADTEYTATWTINTYTVTWKDADGSTLQIDENVPYGMMPSYGSTPTKATDEEYVYTFAGWDITPVAVTADATYTATYSTTPVVASVTISGTTTYYTTFNAAWSAANSATAASTIKLLSDITATSILTYNNSNTQDCTLDMNGHTISSTKQAVLNPTKAGITFTLTDNSENHNGKLLSNATDAGTAYGVLVSAGTFVIENGTIEAHLKANTSKGIRVSGGASFTMNGGTIEVETTNSKDGDGVFTSAGNATVIIHGGEIHVHTAETGYAVNVAGTTTITGGKFSGSTSDFYRNGGTASINGGYYVHDSNLEANCATNYHVLPASLTESGITYNYEVAEAYTLTWNLYGGSIATPGTPAGYVKKGAALTAPTVTKTGYSFVGWTPAVAATMPEENTTYTATWESAETGFWLDIVDWTASTLTINANGWTASGWPYTINDVVYYKDEATATAAGSSNYRAADRTLTIPYSGAAGTDLVIKLQDKDENIISQHSYKIPFIGTTAGAGTEDTVYVNEGPLTISTNTVLGGLYVRPEASVTIKGGTLTVGKLVLRTLPWQAAAISGSFTATDTWYTRIAPNKRTITGPYAPITYESASYYQFALPLSTTVALKDIRVSHGANTPYGSTWLLKYYNEESRAANGAGSDNWVALGENETVQGGVGYEMFSNSNYYREFYFPVGAVNSEELGTTTAVSYHIGAAGEKHAGWNIVASPLMSVYDNTDANPETGLKVSWLMTDGSYDQGVPEYIYPAIPFSYQAGKSGSISFVAGSSLAALAPRRAVAAEEEQERIQWIHLDVKDADGVGDHTSVLSHPTRYEDSYKTGIDVAKQSFEASRALIYSSHAYGEMAFAGVADSLLERGVALTLYSPSEQKLTISMRENNWLDRLAFVWLLDKETGARTDLLMNDYRFKATEGITTGRFYIEGQFFAPQVATNINPIQSDDAQGTKAQKVLINDKMYIIVNGQMFDATGKLVTNK